MALASTDTTQTGSDPAAIERLDTRLDGPLLLAPRVFGDERGFFTETYRASWLADLGVHEAFVQENHSRSSRGVLRGMHLTIGDGASKLVRCGRGRIIDVLVDVRRGSPQYGEWEAYDLSDENMRILYAPVGFAHGFCVVSDLADVLYKQSGYYSAAVERGFAVNDPEVAIDWPLPAAEQVISERDLSAPTLRQLDDDLPFEYES
jgi:dTDP-4-dehydrorhamnose 3,5-epimerase